MAAFLLVGGCAGLVSCGTGGGAGARSSAFAADGGWSAQRLRHAGGVGHHRRMGTGYTSPPTIRNARIGALFDHDSGGDHFCTASVVQSPGKDLIVTAAHCIHGGRGRTYKSDIVFVPSYRDGVAPKGEWHVRRLVVDRRWIDSSDPDLDVGFVVLQPLGGRHIEDVLGGNRLGDDMGSGRKVKLTGYPSNGSEPISCHNVITRFGAHQLRIACTGFPGGTSGSPWLTGFDPVTRTGTVIGVIGGYQAGGNTPDVSYSAVFGQDVHELYLAATAQEGRR
ncbi:trypsin-like serine protease [Streptomyces sp. RB6PN25]|uniref:Trypsin-like serine protease n=1 Tax=Streptomyces humicola TaxID=2953240 RepID=A0ABT1PQS7_9ACTN|nr:trypsin-like serine protease [Streptomyces humicola]MCQ4080013.1 trypsin-like serine protease [Streptomyces humicola]